MGEIADAQRDEADIPNYDDPQPCRNCGGTGRDKKCKCTRCEGTGYDPED